MGVGRLVPYLVVLLVTVSQSWQRVCLRWVSFEMDASAIKSLMPGTYNTTCSLYQLRIRQILFFFTFTYSFSYVLHFFKQIDVLIYYLPSLQKKSFFKQFFQGKSTGKKFPQFLFEKFFIYPSLFNDNFAAPESQVSVLFSVKTLNIFIHFFFFLLSWFLNCNSLLLLILLL